MIHSTLMKSNLAFLHELALEFAFLTEQRHPLLEGACARLDRFGWRAVACALQKSSAGAFVIAETSHGSLHSVAWLSSDECEFVTATRAVFGVWVRDVRVTDWAAFEEQFAIVDAKLFVAADWHGPTTSGAKFETHGLTRVTGGCDFALTHVIPPDQCDPINVTRSM
jgi:hypothetical protein